MASARAVESRLSHWVRRAATRSAPARIARQDRLILSRRPELLALKYRKMAENAFSFFRGAAALFYGDVKAAEGARFGKGAKALLVGDLHVENLGTVVKRGGKVAFGINDFDEAMLGPAVLDLKRFATSLVLSGQEAGLSAEQTSKLVRRFAEHYRKAAGRDRGVKLEGAVRKWLKEARGARLEEWLAEIAPKVGGRRQFLRTETTRPVAGATREHLSAAFRRYAEALPGKPLAGYRIADAVSAVSGTASIGRGRYRLLLEKPGVADPIVIEFKEQLASVLEPFLGKTSGAPADRVVRLSRAVRAKLDPYMRSARLPAGDGVGAGSFLVRRLYPSNRKVGGRLLEDFGSFADLADVAAGRIARAHGRADRVGGSSRVAILAGLPAPEQLAAELDTFAHGYARQVRQDHRAFREALGRDPLLRVRM